MSLPTRRLTPRSEALLGLCWNYLIAHEQALHDRTLHAHANLTTSSLKAHWPTGQPGPTGARIGSTTEDDALRGLPDTGDDEAARTYANDLANIRDDFDMYASMFHASLTMLNRINAQNPTPHDRRGLPLCGVPWLDPVTGKEIPCPKIASPQRYLDVEGNEHTIDELCLDHFNALCKRCHARPAEQYRTHCSTCRKAIQRAAQQESAA